MTRSATITIIGEEEVIVKEPSYMDIWANQYTVTVPAVVTITLFLYYHDPETGMPIGIEGREVHLYSTDIFLGTELYLATAITDYEGKATFDRTIVSPGTYEFFGVFEGDEYFEGC